jgi:hypothetical protein
VRETHLVAVDVDDVVVLGLFEQLDGALDGIACGARQQIHRRVCSTCGGKQHLLHVVGQTRDSGSHHLS